jgi:hypothetical protein
MSLVSLLGANDLPGQLLPSPIETNRFGIGVARVEIGPDSKAAATDVVDLIEQCDIDVVVVRYPADRVSWAAEFSSGRRSVFHADTIVYWELAHPHTVALGDGFAFRIAQAGERDLVDDLARSAFTDYGSHYRANQLFDPADIALGYAEWATSQVAVTSSSVLVVSRGGDDVAFAAIDHADPRSEITLSGVPEWARGQGAYRASMEVAEIFSAKRESEGLLISTQVHNTVVQRVWARRGYLPIHTFETVHFIRHGLPAGSGSRG